MDLMSPLAAALQRVVALFGPVATIDFESRSACDIELGPWIYSRHPSTEVLCLVYKLPGQKPKLWHRAHPNVGVEESPPPTDLFEYIEAGGLVEAHNAFFERCMWRWQMVRFYGWPEVAHEQWRCSAAKASAASLPRALGGAIKAMGLPDEKNEAGRQLMLQMCKPWTPLKPQRTLKKPTKDDLPPKPDPIARRATKGEIEALGVLSWEEYKTDYDAKRAAYKAAYDDWKFECSLIEAPYQEEKDRVAAEVKVWEQQIKDIKAGKLRLWKEDLPSLRGLWDYCRDDVVGEHGLSERLPDLDPEELRLWQLDQRMNERGTRFDVPMAHSALAMADKWKDHLNAELEDLTGLKSASQREKIKAWMAEQDVPIGDTRAPTLERVLAFPRLPSHVRSVIEIVIQANRTSTRKYQAIIDRCDPEDHRARDLLMFHGANTGRWAGKGIQVQNFPRGSAINAYEVDKETGKAKGFFDMDFAAELIHGGDVGALELFTEGGDVMELLSSALRGSIIATEGRDLMIADYAAIEARCVLWLAGATTALQVFYGGGCIYCDMASGIYGYTVIKGVHKDERQFGKVAILGLGYMMGFLKFLLTCRTYKLRFKVAQVRAIMGEEMCVKYGAWIDRYLNPEAPSVEDLIDDPDAKEKFAASRRRAKEAENAFAAIGEDVHKIKHELALAKYVVDVYRTRYPEVKALWSNLEEAAVEAVKGWQDIVRAELGQYENPIFDKDERKKAQNAGREPIWEKVPESLWVSTQTQPEVIRRRDLIEGPRVEVPGGKLAYFVRGGFLCCELPSGRLLRYRDPRLYSEKTDWGETKPSLRYQSIDSVTKKWTRTGTYGGKLAENDTQAVARDAMRGAAFRLEDHPDYDPLISVHDELVSEADQGKGSLEEYEALMVGDEEWLQGCPVKAEGGRVTRYRKI